MSSGGGNSVVDLEFDPAKTIEASRLIDSIPYLDIEKFKPKPSQQIIYIIYNY